MNKRGFTFVELIVVITILAILASISIVAYQSYLKGGYDSNRLVQLSDIADGLEIMSVSSKLPFPDNMIQLTASGTIFAYQGDAGINTIQAIGYDGGGKDPEYDTSFVYMLGKNGRDFQLMGFIRDASLLSLASQSFADSLNYAEFFPKVVGKPLGITLEDTTNIPLHISEITRNTDSYDILSGTGTTKSYLSDTRILLSSRDDISSLIPNKSCKRIQELGRSQGNGVYIISPNGSQTLQVYCDMETDGGGWTYAGYIADDASKNDISFNSDFGGYDKNMTASGSSYMINISNLAHSEALFLFNTSDVNQAEKNDNFLQIKYEIGFPGMNAGDFNTVLGTDFFGSYNGLEYRTGRDEPWKFTAQGNIWGFESQDGSQGVIRLDNTTRGLQNFTGAWGVYPDTRTFYNSTFLFVR